MVIHTIDITNLTRIKERLQEILQDLKEDKLKLRNLKEKIADKLRLERKGLADTSGVKGRERAMNEKAPEQESKELQGIYGQIGTLEREEVSFDRAEYTEFGHEESTVDAEISTVERLIEYIGKAIERIRESGWVGVDIERVIVAVNQLYQSKVSRLERVRGIEASFEPKVRAIERATRRKLPQTRYVINSMSNGRKKGERRGRIKAGSFSKN